MNSLFVHSTAANEKQNMPLHFLFPNGPTGCFSQLQTPSKKNKGGSSAHHHLDPSPATQGQSKHSDVASDVSPAGTGETKESRNSI